MAYLDPTEAARIQAKADDLLRQHNRSARRPLDGETSMSYRRSLAGELQEITPSMKNINLREAVGSAFDLIEKQIYEEASREAVRPTTVPKGEMRELTKYDATNRPFIEFHGSPSAWLDPFSNGAKKRLAGIRTETQRGYIPNN